MKYAVVIERGPSSYGASVPDLPGCFAVGTTIDEVSRLIEEAVEAHIALLRHRRLRVPRPSTRVKTVEVATRRSTAR